VPASVVFAKALPRTASGKLLKSQLRATYGDG
jgi:acyl-coenzyme A synthetase/AMP-(fatty) acid ligase